MAYIRRHRYQERRAPVIAWLYGIARHELQRYQRRQRLELRATQRLGIRMPVLDDESIERINDLVDAELFRSDLEAALAQLSVKERNAVQLRIIERLDYRTVAVRLNCSEQAARVRVHRALSRLAAQLEAV